MKYPYTIELSPSRRLVVRTPEWVNVERFDILKNCWRIEDIVSEGQALYSYDLRVPA